MYAWEKQNRAGYDPRKWGPSAWVLIHLIALSYPDEPSPEQKRQMFLFFNSLKYVLPCGECANGFAKLLKETGFGEQQLVSRSSLFNWSVYVHSLVNIKTGKPPHYDPYYWKDFYESSF